MKRSVKNKKPAARKPRPIMSRRDMRLLEGTALGIFAVLIVGAFGITSIGGIIVHSNQEAAVESAVMVDLTNQNRVENNLPDLTVSPVLTEAAQEKANDEAAKGYFAHTSPQGLDSWYWFKQAGYNFTYAGENLAVDFTDSDAVVNAWMNSPEHRANILNANYTQIGIATAQGVYQGQPTVFVVQEFGTPAPVAEANAPIRQQTQPAQPTQVAVATTRPAAPVPRVLGDTVKTPPPVATQPIAIPTPAPTPTVTPVSIMAGTTVRYASAWDFWLASPKTTLLYMYYMISFLIIIALFMTTGFELKRHHMRSMAVAGSLLVVMCGLFFTADKMVFGTPTIAQAASIHAG